MARWNRLIWAACSVHLNERKRLLLWFVPVMDIAPIQSAGSAGSGSWVWSNLSTTYAINGSPTDRKKELIGSLVLEPSRRRHIFYEKNAPLANRIGGIARVRTGRDGTGRDGYGRQIPDLRTRRVDEWLDKSISADPMSHPSMKHTNKRMCRSFLFYLQRRISVFVVSLHANGSRRLQASQFEA